MSGDYQANGQEWKMKREALIRRVMVSGVNPWRRDIIRDVQVATRTTIVVV
jgi:hypothetical protein